MRCPKCRCNVKANNGNISCSNGRYMVKAMCTQCGTPLNNFIKKDLVTGNGIDIVSKLNNAFPDVEFHAYQIKTEGIKPKLQKYSFLGPNTKIHDRVENSSSLVDNARDITDITEDKFKFVTRPINSLDMGAAIHDHQYEFADRKGRSKKETLKLKHKADKILQDDAMKIFWNSNKDLQERFGSLGVAGLMLIKRKLGLGISHDKIIKSLERMEKKQRMNKVI